MPQTQIEARYGSDAGIYDHRELAKTRFSDFPIGRKNDFTIDPGAIVPVDIFPTLPGDEFDISLRYLLKTMPLVAAPFTVYHVRTHWYYCKCSDLWAGFNTMITKGRSGTISLSVPTALANTSFSPPADYGLPLENEACTASVPQGLPTYLGIAPGIYNTSTGNPIHSSGEYRFWPYFPFGSVLSSPAPSGFSSSVRTGLNDCFYLVSMLPFMMYQKIYRDNYVSPNLLQDNKIWFPDDVTPGWRIDYSGSNLFTSHVDINKVMTRVLFCPTNQNLPTTDDHWSIVPQLSDNCVNLMSLRYAMFENDRFTTSLPWATRGQAPSISSSSVAPVHVYSQNGSIDYGAVGLLSRQAVSSGVISIPGNEASTGNTGYTLGLNVTSSLPKNFSAGLPIEGTSSALPPSLPLGVVSSFGLTADSLRTLLSLSVWQERNARTQGNYNAMIFAHFRTDPNSQEHEPIYIGGTSDLISFSDVVQSVPTSESPAGTSSGLGMTQASGHVGHFRSPDYGYIMGVMIISPQVTYATGLEKFWTQKVMEDFYFPEDEGLGLEEVMKSELTWDGKSMSSPDELFGYQERNTTYKSRHNKVAGMFALPPSADALFSSMSQSRFLNSGQAILSQDFLTMSPKNMRRDYLAYPAYPAMMVSFADNIRARRPMSYQNVPNTFGF